MKLNGILFVHKPRTGGTHFEKLLGFKGHSTPPRCGSALYGSNREELMGWDKEKDAFVHASAVKAAGMRFLNEGDKIEFTLEDGPKGPSAVNLKKLD